MKIAIPKEHLFGETRVAITPDAVKRFTKMGVEVVVEKSAGASSSFTDQAYQDAGAKIMATAAATIAAGDVVLKVRSPDAKELSQFKKGAVLVASLNALNDTAALTTLAKSGVTAFAMELMPRITRAQSMDILSSQSNLAGYKSVLDAASELGRAFPMMMTAAGTIAPAKAFIMGVGVAGLQAIATAKRLGAVVTATDVRPATREQVESLGGKFLEVDAEMEKDAQTEGGYAKEMPPEYFAKQKQVVAEHITKQDVVITTALIPGRPAPVLVTAGMIKSMKPGAVIVDLAVEAGGNVEGSKPGEVVETANGVKIVGYLNVPGRLAEDASSLYARNIFNFLSPFIDGDNGNMTLDWDDEVVTGTLVTKNGDVVHERILGMMKTPVKKASPKKASPKKTVQKKTAPIKSAPKKAALKKEPTKTVKKVSSKGKSS